MHMVRGVLRPIVRQFSAEGRFRMAGKTMTASPSRAEGEVVRACITASRKNYWKPTNAALTAMQCMLRRRLGCGARAWKVQVERSDLPNRLLKT